MAHPTTMQAIRVHEFGGPEVLKLENGVPVQKCGENQVLVKVMSAGVNPVDTYIRSGIGKAYEIETSLPYTPGSDCAGVVVECGGNVKSFKPGDRVWTSATPVSGGVYAEYAIFDVDKGIYPLPAALTFSQGAALGIPYLTAYRALFTMAHAKAGQSVLIHGASGAVGIATVQIARAYGLVVLGTAGTEEGCKFVLKSGAHKVFNHKESDYVEKIMKATNNEGVDIVVEMLANVNLNSDVKMVKTHGKVMVIGNRGTVANFVSAELLRKEVSVVGILILIAPTEDWKESGAAIVAGMEAGWLRPVVEKEYALGDACKAHHDIIATGGRTGKLVLVIAK